MFKAENLKKSYGGQELFSNISFSLQAKERCGLVGRNGSGKSTLLRLLTGQETADAGQITLPKNYRLGFLDQHIRFSQDSVVAEGVLGLPDEERASTYKVEKILAGLGFSEEDLSKSPNDLSGGYQLRLKLAMVLLSEPDCLLLDEPTNYLDIVSMEWLAKTLKQWKGELILISHDRDFMDSVTTHTMGLHRGVLKKLPGSTVDFYQQIVAEEEVHEKTRLKTEKKRAHLQSFVDRFSAKATKAAQAQSRVKQLARIPALERLKELYQLDFHFLEAPFYSEKMLDAYALQFGYEPSVPLIRNVDLELKKGERIAIIGKNGRGKSTLLKLLAGELQPLQGEIKRSDNLQIGYFGQTNIQRLRADHTIEEEIAAANPQLNYSEVKGLCGLMMFSGDLAKKSISVLSGGEKSRVLLGKILARPCNLLLLDEPTHHLDMESIEALIDAMEEFDGTVVIVTHSELILKRLPLDKLIVCRKDKQELFLGNYIDFLEKSGWQEELPEQSAKAQNKQQEPAVNKPKTAKRNEFLIRSVESELETLECSHLALQDKIVAASVSGDHLQIKALQEENQKLQMQIEALYDKLEKLL